MLTLYRHALKQVSDRHETHLVPWTHARANALQLRFAVSAAACQMAAASAARACARWQDHYLNPNIWSDAMANADERWRINARPGVAFGTALAALAAQALGINEMYHCHQWHVKLSKL